MANDDFFQSFLREAANYSGGEVEYYEDTHDENGNYVGKRAASSGVNFTPPPASYGYTAPPSVQPTSAAAQRTEQSLISPTKFAQVQPNGIPQQSAAQPMPLPTTDQYIPPQLNQSFVIYRPKNTADVEQLIAYLRRREPALVDLDPIADSPIAQRLMDFTSGAAYALGDRVMTIRRNLFLITPDTIDVLKPETDK